MAFSIIGNIFNVSGFINDSRLSILERSSNLVTSLSICLLETRMLLMNRFLSSSLIGVNNVSAVSCMPVIGVLNSCASVSIYCSTASLSSTLPLAFCMVKASFLNWTFKSGGVTSSPLNRVEIYLSKRLIFLEIL